jgi:hypothetical protein
MNEVRELDLEAFRAKRLLYDRAVMETLRIDPFCSSSNWMLPSHKTLIQPVRTLILQYQQNFLLLCQTEVVGWGRVWTPFECSWALGSPVIGRHTLPLWRYFTQLLKDDREDWDGVFLCGLPTVGTLWHHCLQGLGSSFTLYQNQTWLRCVASLEGGTQGYLGRRSSKFRKNLRRTQRIAKELGIHMVDVEPPQDQQAAQALLDQAVEIEKRSWKGAENNGILNPEMLEFYRYMFNLLIPTGTLRFSLARQGDRDLGYIFGAVMGNRYRGLQFSYDNDFRHVSLGSLMQWHTIQRMSDEGIQLYDLGMEMEYKYAWSEMTLSSSGLIIYNR